MNNITPVVANQVFIMLILVIVGFLLAKGKLINNDGGKAITNILFYTVTPCVLINAYQMDFNTGLLKEIFVALLTATLIHIVAIWVTKLVFKGEKDIEANIVKRFTSIYTNCGFMGVPLLEATLGTKGVFIGSAYIAMFNIFGWTHGIGMYENKDGKKGKFKIKTLLTNPGVMGVVIAMTLFFTGIRLGGVPKKCVDYIASMNTPLAMILLGTYLNNSNLADALKNKATITVSFVRLLLIPVISIFILKICMVDEFIATAIILLAACPSAAMCAMFAQKFDCDTTVPSQIISVTTIVSLATLPLIAYLTTIII